ncbi:MAG: selenium metabolism-associated LysR family transcriptional regulator [bacterium]
MITKGNNRMNLNQLRVFHTVAKLQSFTKATSELYLTQPGISKHIKELEEYYGIRLFDRLGKKVVLTQAGEILFATTKDMFNLVNEAKIKIDELKGIRGGKLTMGASVTIGIYILPEILGKFRHKYPDIEIALDISLSQEIVEKVLANTIDIGFIGAIVNDERLIIKQFLTDELVVIVSPRHKWADRESIQPNELANETFIISRQGSGTRTIVEERLKQIGVILKKTMEFGNTEAIKKAVEAGLGISIISKYAILREVNAGILKSICLSGVNLGRNFYFTYRKDKYLTNVVKAFLSLLSSPS